MAKALALALLAFHSALAGPGGLAASSSVALYDRVRGQWLLRDGAELVVLGPQGKQRFLVPQLQPGTSFYPVAIANGWLLAVVGGGEGDPGELAIGDEAGKWVGELPLPLRSKLAQDGCAVVVVESTWRGGPATIEWLVHEKLPEDFRGMVVQSCSLPTWRCQVDLYPSLNEPVQDFWPLAYGDVLVSLGKGVLGRFRSGEKLWLTNTSVGYLPLFLDVSVARGELLVVDRAFARLTVYALESGAGMFTWDPSKDASFLRAFVGEAGTEGLRKWCSLEEDAPVRQLPPEPPQGQGGATEA